MQVTDIPAPAILGGFKRQAQWQPSGLEGPGGLLGGTGAAPAGAAPAGRSQGGLASMLDLDGNPLDDILGMAGKMLR